MIHQKIKELYRFKHCSQSRPNPRLLEYKFYKNTYFR